MRIGLSLLLLTGCDDNLKFNTDHGGGDPVTGEGYEAVKQVFTNSCLSGCHEAAVAVAGLNLETDPCAATVGVAASLYSGTLVAPGDSAGSVLWSKMANTGTFGGLMPPGGAVGADTLALVAAWIDEGAPCEGGGTTDDTGDTTDDTGTPVDATYQNVLSEIFTPHCAYCHFDGGTSPDLTGNPSNYINEPSTIWSGHTLVIPFDPDNSFLYQKVAGTHTGGVQMPQGASPLSSTKQNLLHTWILEGAKR